MYEHPLWGTNLRAQLREGLRRTDGIAGDAGAVYGAWGFQAFEVTCPVATWHGNHDRVCPRFVGRWLADVIPGARLHALPEAGHFAIYSHGHEGRRRAARDLGRAGRTDQLIRARTALLVTHA